MARLIKRLTAKKVAEAGVGMFADGANLWLKVSAGANGTLNKSWVFRYSQIESEEERRQRKAAGKRQGERQAGLGPYPQIDLFTARKLAADARLLIAAGKDPLSAKDEQRDSGRSLRAAVEAAKAAEASRSEVPTFDAATDDFFENARSEWRSAKHATNWKASVVQYACPVIGDMPVDAIGIADVLRVLKPKDVPPEKTLWVRAPTTARRLRGRIEKILNRAYALLHANDPAKAKALEAANPAAWGDHLKHLLGNNGHDVEHFAALHYRDAHDFMAMLRANQSLASKCLQFTILTAARNTQAVEARWDEVDFDTRLWTIPKERMKSGREHVVPLSDPAIAILRDMEAIRSGDRVFGTLGRTTMLMTHCVPRGVTVHGMRSCFRTWAAEMTDHPRELAEMALAHVVGDETERSYMHGDLLWRRQELMADWADFLAMPYAEAKAHRDAELQRRRAQRRQIGNVIPLKVA